MFDQSHPEAAKELATDRDIIKRTIDSVLLTMELNVCCHGHKFMLALVAARLYSHGATKEQIETATYNADLIADEILAEAKARK